MCVLANSLQSSPTLCNHRDCSLPGSSIHEVLQARILEWVGIHKLAEVREIPNLMLFTF